MNVRCPKCGLAKDTPRIGDEDPPRARTVLIQCPDCVGGDFDTPQYLDAHGNDVPWGCRADDQGICARCMGSGEGGPDQTCWTCGGTGADVENRDG